MAKPDYAKHAYTPHEVGMAGYEEAQKAAAAAKFGFNLCGFRFTKQAFLAKLVVCSWWIIGPLRQLSECGETRK